jgi:hypothetical protein
MEQDYLQFEIALIIDMMGTNSKKEINNKSELIEE